MSPEPIPCFTAINGKITKLDGSTLSVASALSLRKFYLEDVAEIEARFGLTDPELADTIITHDLKCARELRIAIATVSTNPDVRIAGEIAAAPCETQLERLVA